MSENGDVPADGGGSGRIVRKVVFTYRLDSDPEGAERTLTLEHGGAGERVDGFIWGEELVRKLAYLENGECVEPEKGAGEGEWKLYSAEGESGTEGDCVWVHDVDCNWWKYCAE